jgi:hypothetical protein
VHGKCNKGSSICNKCDFGWEGTLCDIKKDASNINKQMKRQKMSKNKEKEVEHDKGVVNTMNEEVKMINSHMSRDKREDEKVKIEEESMIMKVYEFSVIMIVDIVKVGVVIGIVVMLLGITRLI